MAFGKRATLVVRRNSRRYGRRLAVRSTTWWQAAPSLRSSRLRREQGSRSENHDPDTRLGYGVDAVRSRSAATSAREDVIVVCSPSVSQFVRRANASFTLVAKFRTGPDGAAEGIEVLKAWNGVSSIEPCLKEWCLRSVRTGTEFRVALSWTHGIGWTSLIIETDVQRTVLRLQSAPPP